MTSWMKKIEIHKLKKRSKTFNGKKCFNPIMFNKKMSKTYFFVIVYPKTPNYTVVFF